MRVDTDWVHAANADQAAYWNGQTGQRWVDRQETLDAVLAPILEIILDRAAPVAGERVIDIGCGCGASAIALAERVGSSGRVTGVDISAPMLARARERTRELARAGLPVEFVNADATVHAFAPGGADLLISRFGVMFFADPVLSFRNLRKALRPGGRVAFACWRALAGNPWMNVPLQAALQHVPPPPLPGPGEPGPFAFERQERVRLILGGAGFSNIDIQAVDVDLDLAMGRGLDVAVASAFDAGPVRRVLEGQPPDVVAKVADAARTMLAPYQKGERVLLGAAIWIVTATNEGRRP
jgi:SAM-dependent methyltransferase